jgi:hypothetical protein
MKSDKISVSFPAALGAAVRKAATKQRRGLSAWLAEAAADRIRAEALDEFVEEWARESGPVTAEELDRAAEKLGVRRKSRAG